ncbi:MAG: hypothetical protein RLZZ584_1724 [Pseudomonadota bacterium]
MNDELDQGRHRRDGNDTHPPGRGVPVTGYTMGWTRPTPVYALGQALTSPAAVLLALLALLLCLTRTGRRAAPALQRPALGLVLLVGLALLAKAVRLLAAGVPLAELLPPAPIELLLDGAGLAAALVRQDALVVLSCALFACTCLRAARRAGGALAARLVRAGLQAASLVLVLIAAAELAHYEMTGLNGSGPLLAYALRHVGDIGGFVRSEFDARLVVACVMPPAVWAAGVLLLLLGPGRGTWRGQPAASQPAAGRPAPGTGCVVWPLLLCAWWLPPVHQAQFARLAASPLATLGFDVVVRPLLPEAPAPARADLDASAGPTHWLPTAHTRRHNVVVVMLESVRASATGLADPALRTTPFLQQLAARSLVVDHMYATMPRTSAAWVATLQGQVPGTNAALMSWAAREARQPQAPSLPRLLRPLGYRSLFAVPTHLDYENEIQVIRNMGYDRLVTLDQLAGEPRLNYFGVADRALLAPVLQWVDEGSQGNDGSVPGAPFLLVVMTNVGHHRYELPPGWPVQRHAESSDPDLNNYLNCVAYVDAYLRDLLQGLAERHLLDSTVVVVLGDHGESFGEHGLRLHGLSLHEEALHVPALIHAPGLAGAGGRIGGLRQQIDVLPTIAELLGLRSAGRPLPGTSLLQPVPPGRRLHYSSNIEDVALALRDGRFKYIHHFGRAPMEVYDIEADPGERVDLAAATPPALRRRVEADLHAWYEQVRLAMLHPAPPPQQQREPARAVCAPCTPQPPGANHAWTPD